jgi:hypothetical protein
MERLQAQLAQMALQRDQAVAQVGGLHGQVRHLTVTHRNYERMLIHVLNQRNEALHVEDVLRARQVELEQQLTHAEAYNDNMHEEVHQLHN